MSGSIFATTPKPPALLRVPQLGDMPVPSVTCYATEDQEPYQLVTAAGPVLMCGCVFGEGKPQLGTTCPPRQRKMMTQRRCNACGGRINEAAVFAGVAHIQMDPLRVADAVLASLESPTHPRCLGYSAICCPALQNEPQRCLVAIVEGDYPLVDQWRTGRTGQVEKLYVPHDTPRYVEGTTRPRGALGHIYARLDQKVPGIRYLSLAQWMSRSAPQPYRGLWLAQQG